MSGLRESPPSGLAKENAINVHDFTVATADGGTKPLSDYDGSVLLIVNVASKCGLTPQYEGLERLHREFGPRGVAVLGFPCNQFGGQEPGTDDEIQMFCSVAYDVTFPVFAKIDVNGDDAAPLYRYLREQDPGSFAPGSRLYDHVKKTRPEALESDEIRWNFTKFLVDRDGEVVRRYESTVTPDEIEVDLVAILDESLQH